MIIVNNLEKLIRKVYYEDEYGRNIEYFENELKKDDNNQDYRMLDIIYKYYITKEPNLEKEYTTVIINLKKVNL